MSDWLAGSAGGDGGAWHLALVATVHGLQLFSATCFLLVAWHYAACAGRIAQGSLRLVAAWTLARAPRRWRRSVARWLSRPVTRGYDAAGFWAWAHGVVQIGFVLHWLIMGRDTVALRGDDDLTVWAVCYLLNGAAALGILHSWRHIHAPRPLEAIAAEAGRRARVGAALFAVQGVACVIAAWLVI